MRFADVVLWVSAATWAAFGVWLLATPWALSAAEINVETATARAEVRAFYGGLEIGVAVALAWFATRGETASGLRVALAVIACTAAGRLAGVVVEGFAVRPIILILLAVEVASAVLTGVALAGLRRSVGVRPS